MITRNNPVLITLAIGALFLSMLNICRLTDLSRGEAVASRKDAPPRTLFVFLAGIEGTGHHLYETLYNEKSVKLGYIDRITGLAQDLVDLQSALHNTGEPEKALFTGPLAFQKRQVHPDGDALFRTVVDQLRVIDGKALQWPTDRQQHEDDADPILAAGNTFPIPINAYLVHGPYGQMSYPHYGSPSRSLQYPDLHLLYRACDAANVACGHVYLHRDPYDIMESTVSKRHFAPEDDQITLYTTMLGVLRGQLLDWSARSIACLDFDHLATAAAEPDTTRRQQQHGGGHNDLGTFLRLFGITVPAFRDTYRPPVSKNNNTNVSPYLHVYMDTFAATSRAVWDTCEAVSTHGWAL